MRKMKKLQGEKKKTQRERRTEPGDKYRDQRQGRQSRFTARDRYS